MGKNNNSHILTIFPRTSGIRQHHFVQVLSTEFRFLWLGQIGAQFATNMMLFVLAIRAYQITGTNTAVSGLFLAFGIPSLVFGMLAGVFVDHLDKRAVLSVTSIVRSVLVLGLLFLSHNLWAVYVIAFVNAVITQFYVPAEAPLIPRLVGNKLLVSANSLFSFTFYSSLSMGFILAGPALKLLGGRGTFLFISFCYLVAAAATARISAQEENVEGIARALKHNFPYLVRRTVASLRAGLRVVTHNRTLAEAIFLLSGTQVVLAILGTLGPGFADRVLEIDVRDASVIILAPAVAGILVGALWIGSYGFRFKAANLINTGVIGAGGLLVLISLLLRLERHGPTSWLFTHAIVIPLGLLLFFLLGVANSFLDVPANSTLQKGATGEMRGRIYGILTAAVGGVGILPVVAGGVLADALGIGKVLLGTGSAILAYGIYRIRYNKG